MAGERILVVDDEPGIREICRLYLERDGFSVREAASVAGARAALQRESPALVVLDLMLPDGNGLDLCRELVDQGVPVICLTARAEETDRVLGLELGADDYVTKPFSPRELVARVRAVLRRARGPRAAAPVVVRFGRCAVDLAARRLLVDDREVPLTPKEFDLLALLVTHPHRVFTRQQLLEQVWDFAYAGDTRTVDVHVQRLRRKIEPDPQRPRYLKTVWSVGYRFDPEGEAV
ncbi:two component transcriptional regulator, winged helix family [Thermaerobacter marianensis DSM 12885]|uniref:Stage 0 sporulation protein A homolog n=1 Tax=Thermaerobacter marianensis (strain ATCC 700841 / DSM 12885 / JCM 10246 / 7p75a) TaxID=644966 RepID=E6SMB0_THEM7|nr:response regulator transcription factor [Thermaerobacter marianensis]ADU51469.1 two component transcriptional regulator, winged helix family [Thermaerobacter marianensis DSM 12885]